MSNTGHRIHQKGAAETPVSAQCLPMRIHWRHESYVVVGFMLIQPGLFEMPRDM